jgi:DNA primase
LGDKRDRVLMFADRLTGSDHAVLCEGPMDALKAHLCGGNVATMGKVVHRNQIALIRNAGIGKIYLALDPDAAAETGKLVSEIGIDMECYQILPPPGREDLGECTPKEVYSAMLGARRVTAAHVFIFVGTH